MNILQLCNKIPYPPKDGGAIAMFNMAEGLVQAGNSVTILAMNTGKHQFRVDDIPEKYAAQISFNYVSVDTSITIGGALKNLLFSHLPYNAQRFLSEAFSRKLIHMLQQNSFDLIQLEGLYLCPYIDVIRRYSKSKIALRAHNIETEIWERMALNTKNPIRKFYLGILAQRMRKFEQSFLNSIDFLVPISNRDQKKLREMGSRTPSHTCITGIKPDDFIEETILPQKISCFFIGALDWMPNQEGLMWILEKVWPEIKKADANLEFHIAGRNAPTWLTEKLKGESVYYHGEVENAGDFMQQHHIMLAPLFAGSGIRIKIIEALSCSKVVVTTPIGAEGLGLTDGKEAAIKNDEISFANAVLELSHSKPVFKAMREKGYHFALNNYNNSLIVEELVNFYETRIA